MRSVRLNALAHFGWALVCCVCCSCLLLHRSNAAVALAGSRKTSNRTHICLDCRRQQEHKEEQLVDAPAAAASASVATVRSTGGLHRPIDPRGTCSDPDDAQAWDVKKRDRAQGSHAARQQSLAGRRGGRTRTLWLTRYAPVAPVAPPSRSTRQFRTVHRRKSTLHPDFSRTTWHWTALHAPSVAGWTKPACSAVCDRKSTHTRMTLFGSASPSLRATVAGQKTIGLV